MHIWILIDGFFFNLNLYAQFYLTSVKVCMFFFLFVWWTILIWNLNAFSEDEALIRLKKRLKLELFIRKMTWPFFYIFLLSQTDRQTDRSIWCCVNFSIFYSRRSDRVCWNHVHSVESIWNYFYHFIDIYSVVIVIVVVRS